MQKRVVLFAAIVALVGCGKEVGRISLKGEGDGDTTVSLGSGQKVALWTSLDLSWSGNVAASYTVELHDSSGKILATTTCDPFSVNTKVSSVVTNINDHHNWSYQGKMQCDLTAPSAGAFTVHTKLTFPTKPTDLSVKDMSLVLKI